MNTLQSIYTTFRRYRTLQTDRILSLPVVILMPHSACNCRCIMCDIWKDNKNLRQLNEKDISDLLISLRRFKTQQVLLSGGEALLNPNIFRLCELIRGTGARITLLSTGLTLKQHASSIVKWIDDVIISLDGDEELHDNIRNIPGAWRKMREGIDAIRAINTRYPITSRTVIHRLNFQKWTQIISSAKQLGLDQVSFLPADVSSHAFNREVLWSEKRKEDILLSMEELPVLQSTLSNLIRDHHSDIINGFIAESESRLLKIYDYYAAFHGLTLFPYKKCNAPWVSTVIEADGTVRPCFFHAAMGNIRDVSLDRILNSEESIRFRKQLDINTNDTCVKCVCYLHLSPRTNLKTNE